MKNENQKTNLETLREAFTGFEQALDTGNDTRKSIGATIAETVRQAYATENAETIAWLEQETENKNPVLKAAKGYVSKGRAVGKHPKFKADDRSVSSLYDIIRKEVEEAKIAASVISARAAQDNAALIAVLGSQDKVNSFVATADKISLDNALSQGHVILAAQETEQAEAEFMASLADKVTECKAFLDLVKDKSPSLFAEIQAHVKGASQGQGKKQAA